MHSIYILYIFVCVCVYSYSFIHNLIELDVIDKLIFIDFSMKMQLS